MSFDQPHSDGRESCTVLLSDRPRWLDELLPGSAGEPPAILEAILLGRRPSGERSARARAERTRGSLSLSGSTVSCGGHQNFEDGVGFFIQETNPRTPL